MKKFAIGIGALALAATAAIAGPADGNRPGPSPAPWLQPPWLQQSRPYALTGEQPKRMSRDDGKWTRHTEHLAGGKVVVDVYRR